MKYIHIGFLDSGVGGLAYLEGFQNMYADKKDISIAYKCTYLADHAAFPYGEKSKEYLIERLHTLSLDFIEKCSLDILIIACNTASLLIIDSLRDLLKSKKVLVVGTVPAIKPAVESKISRVYVMNTNAASHSEYAQQMASSTKEQYGFESKIFLRGCQDLVSAIEQMIARDESSYEAHTIALLDTIAKEIIDLECGAVVLGCTHFLHIKSYLTKLLPSSIVIVDSLEGISNRILYLLSQVFDYQEINNETELVHDFYYTCSQENEASGLNAFHANTSNFNIEDDFKNICKRYQINFAGIFR